MTKTKIISISVILLSIFSMQSCSENEMDQVPENKILVEKIHQEDGKNTTESDSLKTTSNYHPNGNGHQVVDPPPKDRDQWKVQQVRNY